MRYVAVRPKTPPTAMEPNASYAMFPVTCAASSAAVATPHPATAAASSATTATEVGSWPARTKSRQRHAPRRALSRSAPYATRRL